MSTDWNVSCQKCQKTIHLGQRFASDACVFGYGSNDAEGRKDAAEFINEHLEHGPLVVHRTDTPMFNGLPILGTVEEF